MGALEDVDEGRGIECAWRRVAIVKGARIDLKAAVGNTRLVGNEEKGLALVMRAVTAEFVCGGAGLVCARAARRLAGATLDVIFDLYDTVAMGVEVMLDWMELSRRDVVVFRVAMTQFS